MRCRESSRRLPRNSCKLQASVEMSNGRSLAGTSLAAETSARPFLWIQRLAPRFPESLDVARTSASHERVRHVNFGKYGPQSKSSPEDRDSRIAKPGLLNYKVTKAGWPDRRL